VDIYAIVKAFVDNGFDGYVRPDHGRNIWGEDAKPGYGLFDRALGATYLYGVFEAVEKGSKQCKSSFSATASRMPRAQEKRPTFRHWSLVAALCSNSQGD
jgi:hypothetical protein